MNQYIYELTLCLCPASTVNSAVLGSKEGGQVVGLNHSGRNILTSPRHQRLEFVHDLLGVERKQGLRCTM